MRRIVASRSFSPARIAFFISSVMRSFRAAMLGLPRDAHPVGVDTLHMPLDGGSFLAFPLLSRLLVEFAPAQFREDSGLFAGALETPQGGIEILGLSNSDARHRDRNKLGVGQKGGGF